MAQSIRDLAPQLLWQHFDDILKIPRPSGKEEKIREWLVGWARAHAFDHSVDKAGNVVVRVHATRGREKAPAVVLQSHCDMVCEKNADKVFDFDKDPIGVAVDGEWLVTTGTSMGADNGMGMAAGMAVALDKDAAHGPLELLFTVDEETGLTGANNIDPSSLEGKILLNLDSEEEGTFFVGCSGGGDGRVELPLETAAAPAGLSWLKVKLTGMKGGHSGLNIHENRANAIKAAARLLRAARGRAIPCALASIDGGDKHNAIPRECVLELGVPAAKAAELQGLFEEFAARFMVEFRKTDPGMRIEQAAAAAPAGVLTDGSRDRLVALLLALPHGVLTMSRDIAGLVETSSNLASIHIEGGAAAIVTSSRSSVAPALRDVRDAIAEIAGLAGAKMTEKQGYPGWQPNMDSPLLAKTTAAYKEKFGRAPLVTAVHAGLECGILGEKFPGMDMISFGPTLSGVHSPDEKVHVGSVAKFYDFLKALLASMG